MDEILVGDWKKELPEALKFNITRPIHNFVYGWNDDGTPSVSFDFANATAESMRSQVDDLINYFLEAKANGSTVIFPVTGVGQDLVGMKPQAVATRKTYSGKVTSLQPNQIFVFGSNPEGRHGAGAAKYAKDNFGAIYGQGEGLQGQSYALPTKDLRVKANNSLRSISPQDITSNIKKLYDVARANPTKEFLVSDYSESNLNGYTGQEMANMFNAAGPIPSNMVFNENFERLLNPTQAPAGEINPDTSPLAYQTFLYLSEQLAKHFNYINPNFSQVTAAEPETTVGEKPAEEDVIEFTDEDFKNSFILLDCLYTNS